MFYKILAIILGVILIIGGVSCMATPLLTYSTIPVMMGITMLMAGVGIIIAWSNLKQRGGSSPLLLIDGILTTLLGIFVVSDPVTQIGMAAVVPYFVAGWMCASGILTIVDAFRIRKLRGMVRVEGGEKIVHTVRKIWWVYLILGILSVVAGILSFTNPMMTAEVIGTMMGIDVVIGGINLIAIAVAF